MVRFASVASALAAVLVPLSLGGNATAAEVLPSSNYSMLNSSTSIHHRRLLDAPKGMLYYILQMRWWPAYCESYFDRDNHPLPNCPPLCSRHSAIPIEWGTRPVVHGLWPTGKNIAITKTLDGLKPNRDPGCRDGVNGGIYTAPNTRGVQANSPLIAAYRDDHSGSPKTIAEQKIFPGRCIRPGSTTGGRQDMYEHEFKKHGACSGMTQADYFKQAVEVGRLIHGIRNPDAETQRALERAHGAHLVPFNQRTSEDAFRSARATPQAIIAALKHDYGTTRNFVKLTCTEDGNNRKLSTIDFCFSTKNLIPHPAYSKGSLSSSMAVGEPIDCPGEWPNTTPHPNRGVDPKITPTPAPPSAIGTCGETTFQVPHPAPAQRYRGNYQ